MKYTMPFINDKDLFKAVMFANKMIRDGTPPGIANGRAASYYGFETSDVAHYTGLRACRIKQRKNGGPALKGV